MTVATNMAGRGTDIRLVRDVAERGGLHVLSLQLNPSRRLDRQLAGRCARQGDPGSAESWLFVDLMKSRQVPLTLMARGFLRREQHALAAMLTRVSMWWWQREQEQVGARARARLLLHDQYWDGQFAPMSKRKC